MAQPSFFREKLVERIGYLRGVISTMELYAIWNNGERFIGVMREPLKEATKPFTSELEKLAVELSEIWHKPC